MVDIKYPKEVHGRHSDMLFLPNQLKNNKFAKLVCNLSYKINCHTNKSCEAGAKPWIDIRETTQGKKI